MYLRKSNRLYCFSPPVMIATFVIETVLLIYTVVRYRMSPLTRIVAGTLALLAIFQFAEYHVCGHSFIPASWSRVGFVAITLLPPLGIHLVQQIAGKKSYWQLALAYGSSLAFVVLFALDEAIFKGHVCAGNYAIFQMKSPMGGLYFMWYYLVLFCGIIMSLYYAHTAKPNIRKALYLQILGYFSFVLPTSIVNAINPQTLSGVPSIMCGFAVSYALILTFGVVPLVLKPKK
ncbi:MAG TPA: hypothetical protein VLA92_03995 [Candidatus Saccharimonadales bacterium]|nr:hypothetical protein [Candidatus Saccharimonadales bacterium]